MAPPEIDDHVQAWPKGKPRLLVKLPLRIVEVDPSVYIPAPAPASSSNERTRFKPFKWRPQRRWKSQICWTDATDLVEQFEYESFPPFPNDGSNGGISRFPHAVEEFVKKVTKSALKSCKNALKKPTSRTKKFFQKGWRFVRDKYRSSKDEIKRGKQPEHRLEPESDDLELNLRHHGTDDSGSETDDSYIWENDL